MADLSVPQNTPETQEANGKYELVDYDTGSVLGVYPKLSEAIFARNNLEGYNPKGNYHIYLAGLRREGGE